MRKHHLNLIFFTFVSSFVFGVERLSHARNEFNSITGSHSFVPSFASFKIVKKI
jgi:hypothetical protein